MGHFGHVLFSHTLSSSYNVELTCKFKNYSLLAKGIFEYPLIGLCACRCARLSYNTTQQGTVQIISAFSTMAQVMSVRGEGGVRLLEYNSKKRRGCLPV